jgi:hypothetical protein
MKRLPTAVTMAFVAVLVGCSAAAPAPPSPSPVAPAASPSAASSSPDPMVPPDDGVVGGGGGGVPPAPGQPTLVAPKPGQMDVHEVAIEELSARVSGHRVVVNARWTSGVEPCHVLDSVAYKRDGRTITIAVREGSSARDAMCIELAMFKVTAIDLGELEAGDYTIVASQGAAAAITVTVS